MIEVEKAKLEETVIACQACRFSQEVELPEALLKLYHGVCPRCGGPLIGAHRRWWPRQGTN